MRDIEGHDFEAHKALLAGHADTWPRLVPPHVARSMAHDSLGFIEKLEAENVRLRGLLPPTEDPSQSEHVPADVRNLRSENARLRRVVRICIEKGYVRLTEDMDYEVV